MDKHNNDVNSEMLYGLDDKMPTSHLILYGIQHLIYLITGSVIMPVIVGGYLGLDQLQIAELLQRTFLLSGLISILQVTLGHRYPIVDGPAGLWSGLLIVLTKSATAFGKDLSILRTDLELGMIIAGIIIILLVVLGLMPKIAKIFNPIVNGTFLMLMVLQLSSSIMRGATGITEDSTSIDLKSVFVFVLTVGIIIVISLKTTGFLQSIATLIGVGFGWIAAIFLDIAPGLVNNSSTILSLPDFFAWGRPTYDLSVIITCILGSVLLFSNLISSISGMSDVVGDTMTSKQLNRSTIIYGFSTSLAGIIPILGQIPFASSMGVVSITRVASRRPFILGGVFMTILGLISPVGAFFSAIPLTVGYAAMLIIFSLTFRQALAEFRKISLGNRESLIVGISVITGIGTTYLPARAFDQLPQMFRYIVSNGLIVGIILAIVLEHVLLRRKKEDENQN